MNAVPFLAHPLGLAPSRLEWTIVAASTLLLPSWVEVRKWIRWRQQGA